MVWLFYAPLGLFLTLLQVFATGQGSLVGLGLSCLVLGGITVPLFYLGFFGGADVKAFISLSLALPFEIVSFTPYLGVISPLYSMSIFQNAVLASAVTGVILLFNNILWRVRTGEEFFEGLDDVSLIKRLLALFTGYKVDLSELKRKFYLVPMEKLSRGENGKLIRSLKLFVGTDVDRDALVAQLEDFAGDLGKIWVTPYLPYIVFIMIGLVVTLLMGDILFWLIIQVVGTI